MLGLKQIGLTDSRSKQFFFPGHWLERDELQKTGHSNDEDSLIDGNSLTLVCSRDYSRPGGGGRSPLPPPDRGRGIAWVGRQVSSVAIVADFELKLDPSWNRISDSFWGRIFVCSALTLFRDQWIFCAWLDLVTKSQTR